MPFCDALRLSCGPLGALRGATPPSRNNLSHANKHRDASLMEKLFWSVLDHLKQLHPRFAGSKAGKRLMHRFKRTIHVVDSTTNAAPPPFTHTGYNRFFDPDGYPAVKPPWGTLNAIDLNTGEYRWTVTLVLNVVARVLVWRMGRVEGAR
jgi:hypothetical protein